MNTVTQKSEIEKLQSGLVPRLVNEWALLTSAIPADIMASTYANMGTHTLFMGEITKALVK
ncbi:MAG: hypothetical protein ACOX12_01860 [Eggerthellaceae bacterium]|jgi:hypothetical protein